VERLGRFVEGDGVTELLRAARVSSSLWCRSELGAPWGLAIQGRELPTFHVVASGACWLDVDGLAMRQLAGGDLVVLPHGDAHALRDDPATPVMLLDDLLADTPVDGGHLRHGGGGARTELLCGAFSLDGRHTNPVLAALPRVVHVQATETVAWTLTMLGAELASPAPGSEAMTTRLTDVLVTHALRAALEESDAVRDSVVAPAVRLVNEHPERGWTLEELARSVALSRSAFSERFRRATGEAPMRYLSRVRLTRAAGYLRGSDATLGEIAAVCGYSSEFTFSRAFKRAFGVAPGRFRSADDRLG
jgi:AraC-like DNA-binding protein